ncbi:MAG: dihydrolipoyl dehydrogenase [candidate division Zixibacteria bacterium]|nr:dihydrolipoyl dehydrogenase [candidate division Zixibacteria bacterium]MDH3937340.1 dihydrolipoyl dehydrogenase [candidate division Zixibacteria bacterium]MDH4033541.1 dihydrolipoyl dehydrogenase [candidate division Zixibacteria bacterium]
MIIGGGPGGYTAGIRAAIKGAKVAVVEVDRLGGVCLNKGCIPSKALIASAVQYQKLKEAQSFGLTLGGAPGYDWTAMLARKEKIVGSLVGGIGQLFKSHGVTHYQGFGRIADSKHLIITDEDGQETKIKTANIIVATGSRAMNIPTFPIDGVRVLTSDHLLKAQSLPETILIVGAGVIGCEWAFMLSMLDVKVQMVEMLPRALPLEDADVSKLIERELKKVKTKLYTNTKVESMQPGPSGVSARLSNGQTIEANQVLMAVGRSFNTEELGLVDLGVKLNKNGSIKTGADMRTSHKSVFAIGDVRGEIMLAYTAVHDGAVAVDNALGGKVKRDYSGVPSVIFTHPEVASVGLTEEQAAEKHNVVTSKFPLRTLGKAHAENEISGEVKLVADKKTDRLLGTHIVGSHATEIIHTAALAVKQGLTVRQLGELIFGHPVISEALMEAAHNLHNSSVHLPRKK